MSPVIFIANLHIYRFKKTFSMAASVTDVILRKSCTQAPRRLEQFPKKTEANVPPLCYYAVLLHKNTVT